jgi:hypothetical protein
VSDDESFPISPSAQAHTPLTSESRGMSSVKSGVNSECCALCDERKFTLMLLQVALLPRQRGGRAGT